jgi:hypothetical protein
MAGVLDARLREAQTEKLAPIDFLSRLVQDGSRLLSTAASGERGASPFVEVLADQEQPRMKPRPRK